MRKKKEMIIEGLLFCQYNGSSTLAGDGSYNSVSDLDFAACWMVGFLSFVIYFVLVLAALYTSIRCNSQNKNPIWYVLNILTSIFFPTLYLLIHPNMVLSHSGPKPYCETD